MEIFSSYKVNSKISDILQNANCLLCQMVIIDIILIKNRGIII